MTFELARAWVRRGHQVTVFTSDQLDGAVRFKATEEILEGISIHRFRNPAMAARCPSLFFRPRGMASALGRLKGTIDLVHVVESRGPQNRWVARHVPGQGIPYVWSAYGGLAQGHGFRKFYRSTHDRVFDTAGIVQRAAGLIAQTAHEEEVYRSFGADPDRIRRIPLAVNWNDFSKLPERGQFRRKLGLGDEERLILFLGRIHWTKGLQVLIPAFAAAARKFPEARLVIVGWDHGYLGASRDLVAQFGLGKRVLFPGPLYGQERFKAYVDSDLFALTPGVFEETSLAALEACASGVGSVITRQCEIPGLDGAGAGKTVDYDVDSVAQAIAVGLSGDASRRWGDAARSFVRERFSIESVAALHESLFQDVIDSVARGLTRPLNRESNTKP